MDTPPISMPAFLLLLHIVSAGEPMYGRQLAVAARQAEDIVYPALRRLETLGLLSSEEEEVDSRRGGKVRRYYRPTDAGVATTTRLFAEIERIVGDVERRPRSRAQLDQLAGRGADGLRRPGGPA